MLKLVAKILKYFAALLIIFKMIWWSNKIIFRFVFSKDSSTKLFFMCTNV